VLAQVDHSQAEELENTMLCARWLVGQFESLDQESIARIFQKAVEDAEAWIHTMVARGQLPREYGEPIKAREAAAIHNILIRYASIDDPDVRKNILAKMIASTNKGHS